MSVRCSTLRNGLRVVTDNFPRLETASLGIWVDVGSRCETLEQHGVSHFLEHMAFKGTPSRSARELAEQIESVGGEVNAATSLESTAYFARVMKADVRLALEVIADILSNPLFDPEELERERSVILHEIAATHDQPDDLVFDLAQEAAFPDQSLGRPILGSVGSVASLGAADLQAFLTKNYTAPAMILVAAGAVDHDTVVREAEQLFTGFDGQAPYRSEGARYAGGTAGVDRDLEQSHLVLAYEGVPYSDSDFFAAQILAGIVGGGMSSRLFQEAREKRALCYSIYAYCWGLTDTGLFGVNAGTGPDEVEELMALVGRELARAASAPPSEAELDRAKAQLRAGAVMCLESSGARAEQLARHMLRYGRPIPLEELITKVDAVGGEDVRRLAERLLVQAEPTLSIVGPPGQLDSCREMLEKLH